MRYGHGEVIDGILRDGLTDGIGDFHMGMAGEKCAEVRCRDPRASGRTLCLKALYLFTQDFGQSRADQDRCAAESYRRALAARQAGHTSHEVAPIEVRNRAYVWLRRPMPPSDLFPAPCRWTPRWQVPGVVPSR